MTIRDRRSEGLGVNLICDDCQTGRWFGDREVLSVTLDYTQYGWRKIDYNRHVCRECAKKRELEQQEVERKRQEPVENQKCDNCRFYKNTDPLHRSGQCYRYPPIVAGWNENRFPSSANDEWCGEWEEKCKT